MMFISEMIDFCFASIGILSVVYAAYYIFQPFIAYFVLQKIYSKRNELKKAGDWAIVTGATDGIGKAMAESLAKEGLNIFLISRSIGKLMNVSTEIESVYNVQTKFFTADFTRTNFYDDLKKEINALSSVSCLINNVGMSYQYPDDLANGENITPEFIQNLITCNDTSMACMCRVVLPKLLSDCPTKYNRFIVNLSSYSGLFSNPYLAVYAASKAFVINLSLALSAELENTCVKVQALTPSYVVTNMSKLKHSSRTIPSATVYANSALNMIGVQNVCCGYFCQELVLPFILMVPEAIRNRFISKMLTKVRTRYLAKAKKM